MALDINAVWERSSGATSYKIGVRVNSGAWVEYASTTNSFNLGGFSLNDFVEARVRGVNDAGQSEWTDIDSVTILGALPTPLSGLTATGISTGIRLDWNDNADNETGYRIYRSIGGGGNASTWTWTLIHTTAANIETYEDTLAEGTVRYYIVIAVSPRGANPTLDNSYANYVTTVAGLIPIAPSNLVATAVSTSQIDLSWTDNSTNETGFKIYRKKAGEALLTLHDTVGVGVTTYEDTGLDADTEYTYQVRASGVVGDSDFSNSDSDTTDAVVAPSTPTGLSTSEVPTRKVYAEWNVVLDADNYRIRYSIDGGLWQGNKFVYGLNWTSTASFSIGQSIAVQVRAENAGGESAWSASSIVDIGGA